MFHTLLQNSKLCDTSVVSTLHVVITISEIGKYKCRVASNDICLYQVLQKLVKWFKSRKTLSQTQADIHTVTQWPKAGIAEQEDAATDRQRHHKHISAETNRHATKEELLGVVFSVWFTPRLYTEDQREKLISRKSESAFGSRELQVSSGSLWSAVRNVHCYQPLPSNDWWQ
jgi:hypothetical protein